MSCLVVLLLFPLHEFKWKYCLVRCFAPDGLLLCCLPSFSEKRIRHVVQKVQQHLQHRWHHLCHERGEGPRPDNHFQECNRRLVQATLHAQNRRPLHGGQEVLQPRQQSGQDFSHHFPNSVLHLQLRLLGHVRQQKARHYEGKQPKLSLTKCGLYLVWLCG